MFEVDRLELHVDGATLAFSDAVIADFGASSNRVRIYQWRSPVADWQVGQTKAVKITYPRKLVFSDSGAAVTEGSGDLAFWADVDPAGSTEEIRFRVRTDDYYLAEAGTDYEPLDKVVTIPPGRTRAEFPVRLIDDSIAEDNEEFVVTVSEVRGADLHFAYGNTSEAQKSISAVGRILDDDGDGKAVITVTTRGQESVAEGENAVFWVNRLGGPPVDVGVIVEVAELGGDRVGHQQKGTRTLTLKRGTPDMALALRIPTSADPRAGGDGRLSITVQEASEYTVGEPRSATVAVTKGEERTLPTVTLRASRTSAAEGEEVEFTLTRTGLAEAELDVRVDVSETGEVLTGYPWQSRFEPGEKTATITVETRNDPASGTRSVVTVALTEDAERYRLGRPSSATVTVTDAPNQGAVLLEVTIVALEALVAEGATMEFTVSLSDPAAEALDVGLSVSETGASLGGVVPGRVPIPSGDMSVTFTIPTRDDGAPGTESVVTVVLTEDAERYRLGDPSSAAVTVTEATGQQGAVPREVTISAGRASVREGNPVEVTLTRTGGGEAVTIGLRVSETGETLGAAVRQVPLVENAESVTVSAADRGGRDGRGGQRGDGGDRAGRRALRCRGALVGRGDGGGRRRACPVDSGVRGRAGGARRGAVHVRAVVQRGAGRELPDAARPRLRGRRRRGAHSQAAAAGQQPGLDDHGGAERRRRREPPPAGDGDLRGAGGHLHRGRAAAVEHPCRCGSRVPRPSR